MQTANELVPQLGTKSASHYDDGPRMNALVGFTFDGTPSIALGRSLHACMVNHIDHVHILDLVGNDSEGRKQSQASVTRIPMLHPRTFTHYLSIVIRRSLLPTLSARVLAMRRGGPRGYYFRASTFTYVRSFTMSTKMQCLHDGKISSSNLSCVKKSVHGCVPASRHYIGRVGQSE